MGDGDASAATGMGDAPERARMAEIFLTGVVNERRACAPRGVFADAAE